MTEATRVLVVVALGLAWPAGALAGTAETYGLDSRASAMGGAGTTLVRGGAAAYYNPAAVRADGRKLSLAFVGAETFFPDTQNFVVAYEGDQPVIGSVDNKTESVAGFALAWTVPLGKRLGLGLVFYHPAQRTLRIQSQDAFLPTYSLYDNQQQRLSFHAAMGFRALSGVEVGAGVAVLAFSNFRQEFNIPAGGEDESHTHGAIGFDIIPAAAPTAGLRLSFGDMSEKLEGLSAGVAFRGTLSLPVNIDFSHGADVLVRAGPSFAFRTRAEIVGSMVLVEHYTPAQVAASVAWDRQDAPLAAALDVVWMQWSGFEGPYIDPTFEPLVLPPLGQLDVSWQSPPDEGFHDTVVPRAGIEWRLPGQRTRLALRAGYSFESSPVPDQTGTSNRLDASKHVITAGAGLRLPFALTEKPLQLDGHVQYHALLERATRKSVQYDCNDPDERPPRGYPCSGEITASGAVLSGGLMMTLHF